MKCIVIIMKDDDEEQEFLDLADRRNLDSIVMPYPSGYFEDQISVNMTDGVTFTLSCDPNQSTTNDNPSSRTAADDVPSTSYRLQAHQPIPPVMAEPNVYDDPQYLDLQQLYEYEGHENWQPPVMNESSGNGARRFHYRDLNRRPGMDDRFDWEEMAIRNLQSHPIGSNRNNAQQFDNSSADMDIDNENDALSTEPSTSSETERSIDDEDFDEHVEYTNQDKEQKLRKSIGPNDIKCQICTHMLSLKNREFNQAQHHAGTHEPIGRERRFECPVDGCTFKHYWRFKLMDHVYSTHDIKNYKPQMTREEEKKWVKHVKKCFPGTNKKEAPPKAKKCNECGDLIVGKRLILEEHALSKHLTHFEYKCDYPNCKRSFPLRSSLKQHKSNKHGIRNTEVELTDDQEEEVADMLKRCFPDEE